jgi:hypothetical protein
MIPPNSFIKEATLRLWVYRNEVLAGEQPIFALIGSSKLEGIQGDLEQSPLIDNCHSFCTTVSPGFVNDCWKLM